MSDGRVQIDVDLDKAKAMQGVTDINKEVGGMAKNISKNMKTAGKNMTKYVTTPILGMAAGMGKAAMDLEATEAKYNTVFKGMTDQSDAFIKEFQKLTPATKAEARSMASGIQDMLIPMGVAREDATEMTEEFMHVSGALANFNSGTHTAQDVTNAMTSALSGQYDSLKSLGIQLDATTVKEKAVEMGLASSTEEVTKSIQAQVLMKEVYAQSGDALDAYTEANLDAKTKMGLLKTEIIDVAAEFGTAMLPAISSVIDIFRDAVSWLNNLSEENRKLVGMIGLVAAAIGPLLLAGSFMIDKFLVIKNTLSGLSVAVSNAGGVLGILKGALAAIFSPIGLVLGVIGLLAGAFVYLYETSDHFKGLVGELITAFKGLFDGTSSFGEVIEAAGLVFEEFVNGLGELIPLMLERGLELIDGFISGVEEKLPEVLSKGLELVVQLINGLAEKAPEFLASGILMLTDLINRIKEELPEFLQRGKELVTKLKDGLIERIPDLVQGGVDLMIGLLDKIIEYGPDLLMAGADLIWELIKGIGSIVWEVTGAMAEIGDAIIEEAMNVDLFSIGKDIVSGLWEGIKSMGDWVGKKAGGFFEGITTTAQAIFNTHSPSRVFRDEIGKMLPQGLVVGVESEEQKTQKKVGDSFKGVIGSSLKALNSVKMPDITSKAVASTSREIITTNADSESSMNNNMNNNYSTLMKDILNRLDALLQKDGNVYLNQDNLVGSIGGAMDRALGDNVSLNKARWDQ
ncbi:MAG: phage tail tape measure protein [Tetragenococcus halophilus]|nr:phage tail tape measure protein [Tetragenococcus halophilus]